MPSVTFLPANVTVECSDGESVFEVARRSGIEVDTACVGKATCGRCRVKIVDGDAFLPPINQAEIKHLGNVYFITRVRLSCQSIVRGGDVTVEVPEPRPVSPPAPPPRPAGTSRPQPAREATLRDRADPPRKRRRRRRR